MLNIEVSYVDLLITLKLTLSNPPDLTAIYMFRMRLPWWAEGPAAGLSAVMLLIPYRILGTKLLWWTWHDTDPTIKERFV